MSRLESRLHKLEAQRQAKAPAYTAAVEVAWAGARVGARTRQRIAEALGVGTYPTDPADRELLVGDTPAQAAADGDQRRKAMLAFTRIASVYVKLYEIAELEPRLAALESAMQAEKDRP